VCVCVCVCVSLCQFLTDFDEIWHGHLEPETKERFRWGLKSNKGMRYFYPFYPKLAPT